MKKLTYILIAAIVISITNCKKAYNPPAINSPNSYLVVEGVISDTTQIRLTNTVNLSSTVSTKPVLGAKVLVANNTGGSFALTEQGNGYYTGIAGLNAADTYQLKIVTADNTAYASDLVAVKSSPAIDSVNYVIKGTNVQINVNTHDPTNNSRYYRWNYIETYLIHTPYYSAFELQQIPTDTIVQRPFSQQINACWITDSSSTIVIGSSAKLAQDVISMQPVNSIPLTSEKFTDLYSILVTQYVLTADAFNYWEQLEKNTEQLGSIFDAQPSQLTGNIHCTSNPATIAIGYISAGKYTSKRIFVDSRKIPGTLHDSPYGSCKLDTLLFNDVLPGSGQVVNDVVQQLFSGYQIPVSIIVPPGSYKILGYSGSTPLCVDCTLRGTNVQPSFWP